MNDINLERLGNEIKRFRTREKLSLREFAPKGVSYSTISRIERFEEHKPDAQTLMLLSQRLKAPVASFLGEGVGKVVYAANASLSDRIAAIIYSDPNLEFGAKKVLIEMMDTSLTACQ